MFRTALLALALVASTPVLAMDMPLLTFPQSPATTTSTQTGK
jgi:hypothetical protein